MDRAAVVALHHPEVLLVAAAVEVMVVRAVVQRRHLAVLMVGQAPERHARVRTVVHRDAQCPVVMDTDRMDLLMAKAAHLPRMAGNRTVIQKAPFVRLQGKLANQLHALRHRKASNIVMRPRLNIVRLRFAWFQDIAHHRNSIIRLRFARRQSIRFVRLSLRLILLTRLNLQYLLNRL